MNGSGHARTSLPFAAYAVVAIVVAAALSWSAWTDGRSTAELFRGPDDFMRTVQVLDWLDGQEWRDTRQRRLAPPDGGDMHWSRLADLPLGIAVAALEPALGRERALRAAVIGVPSLLGGVFVALFLWLAAPLVPGYRFVAPLLTAPAIIFPLLQLQPGRVDHHGLQLVLVALATGFLFRSLRVGGVRAAAAAGGVVGLSLVIGLETLPFVVASASSLALAVVMRREMAPALVAFGMAGTAVALLMLSLSAPSAEWTTATCDRMSLPYLAGLLACAGAGGVPMALARARPAAGWPVRLAAVGLTGALGAAVVAMLFPACIGGPYADLAPEVHYWFGRVSETQSVVEYTADNPGFLGAFVVLPLVALVVSARELMRGGATPQWAAVLVLVLSGVVVSMWQIRATPYAGLVMAIGLLPLALAANRRAERFVLPPARVVLRLGVPVLIATAILLPIALQPSENDHAGSACDVDGVLPALTADWPGADGTLVVAAPIDHAPEILFRTRHTVLAAPYHRNVRSLVDHRRLYAGDEDEARTVVADRGIEAVVFCTPRLDVTAYPDKPGFVNERLADDRPPLWLEKVADAGGMRLYRVDFDP